MQFRAAVLHEVGKPLAIEEVELAAFKPSDVLVRLHASGLCHTDLEVMQGSLRYPLPIVLGHEGAGVVERVGSDVTTLRPGQHVICSWNPNCGHCFYCDGDQPILCEPFTRHQPAGHLLDGSSRLTVGGAKLHHYSMICSHAEYCVVPEAGAVAVPSEVPFDRACLIGCGVMTGVGAVMRVAKVGVGQSVAVLGCGAVGLNVLQGARLAGAEPIIAVDVEPAKLALARAFGAQETLDAGQGDVAARVKGLTRGRGADHVFEAAGIRHTLQTGFDAVRPGGQLVLLGKTDVEEKVALRWGSVMGEKRIVRSSYGGARPRQDFPLLARLYLEGRLKLDELITRRLRLAEINDGFAAMTQGKLVRAVLQLAQ
ncbi:MAG: Zn-dependent alcohol dehydrogenase [Alphaproteobacteria bacterium]|nr:Zn-dependent alcohol dehydrogenase [Alphaproteobacteria bacterium]